MHKEAVEAFKSALRNNPDSADAHFALGLTYFDMNDKASAVEEYKTLKNLDPTLAEKLSRMINW